MRPSTHQARAPVRKAIGETGIPQRFPRPHPPRVDNCFAVKLDFPRRTPIRNKRAVGKASDLIFGNSRTWSKESSHEVYGFPRGRHNDSKSIERCYARGIRLKVLDFGFTITNCQ